MKGRSPNNFRRAIGTLFRFAKVRGYVAATHTGIIEVERASCQTGEIQVCRLRSFVARWHGLVAQGLVL